MKENSKKQLFPGRSSFSNESPVDESPMRHHEENSENVNILPHGINTNDIRVLCRVSGRNRKAWYRVICSVCVHAE
jgi:hypothetical protein